MGCLGYLAGGRIARRLCTGAVPAALLAVALLAGGPARAARTEVQAIAFTDQGGSTRVDLRLSRAARFDLFTLTSPDRVVIDLASAALAPTALPLPTAAGNVREVRVAQRPGGALRIVFDVVAPVRPTATPAGEGATSGLAIELRPLTLLGAAAAPAASAVPSAPAPAPAPAPVPAVIAPAAPVANQPAPPSPSPATEVVVVVDAGHGGHDPGAHGPSGVREKDITLAISRRLVELLNAEPGMRGVLTRSDDRFLDLRDRMERARRANAHLFISIHADAAYNRSAKGSTVYVLSEKGATDEAARRLAARENAALIGGVELGNKDPVLASVLMDLSQNASISSSIAVGDAIIANLGQLGHLHRRTVQQAPFMVLKSPDVPSILIETAYISNPDDERRLASPSHQKAMAGAILDGIRRYFAANPPGGPAAPATTVASSATTVGAPAAIAPATARPAHHIVRRGETLSGVASRYRVSLSGLKSANRLRSDTVWVGQKLRIPREAS